MNYCNAIARNKLLKPLPVVWQGGHRLWELQEYLAADPPLPNALSALGAAGPPVLHDEAAIEWLMAYIFLGKWVFFYRCKKRRGEVCRFQKGGMGEWAGEGCDPNTQKSGRSLSVSRLFQRWIKRSHDSIRGWQDLCWRRKRVPSVGYTGRGR